MSGLQFTTLVDSISSYIVSDSSPFNRGPGGLLQASENVTVLRQQTRRRLLCVRECCRSVRLMCTFYSLQKNYSYNNKKKCDKTGRKQRHTHTHTYTSLFVYYCCVYCVLYYDIMYIMFCSYACVYDRCARMRSSLTLARLNFESPTNRAATSPALTLVVAAAASIKCKMVSTSDGFVCRRRHAADDDARALDVFF